MRQSREFDRRGFLITAAGGAGLLLAGCATLTRRSENGSVERGEKEVTPGEDLMREHGVLKRVLLVYGEGVRRIETNQELPPETIADAASIIRDFIEEYHEKLEEDQLFPRFRKHHVEVQLVETLAAQHDAGRRLTQQTLRLATVQALRDADDRRRLADGLRAFIRMYEPHEAREDTVLFPALHRIVSRHEYAALGEDFEKIEHQKFGSGGFEQMVDRVAAIERSLGIHELAKFTPQA